MPRGQLLGRLRGADRLTALALSYLTDAAVHQFWHHAGIDAVLAPHEHLAAQVRAQAPDSLVVGCAPAIGARFADLVPSDDR